MLLYWILLPLAWVVFHIGFRVRVIGRENLSTIKQRPYVVAANHISELDPVFILISLMRFKRLRILAKKELFENPFAAWFLTCAGAVAVDRGKGDVTTLDKVTEECKNGTGVLIFAEGTRTKTGQLGPLKSGAFVIAGQAGADMIPCRIIYDTPDGRLKLFCRVRVCFGPMIPAAELVIEDPKHSIAKLRVLKAQLKTALEALLAANKFD